MSRSNLFDELVNWLVRTSADRDRVEIPEDHVIVFLQQLLSVDRESAIAEWQALSNGLRGRKVVRNGHLLHWHVFKNCLQVTRLATAEEIQGTAEIYGSTTDEELARRIRALSGFEFERCLTAVLVRRPEFGKIQVTQATRDGGIDFRGEYVAPELGRTPLIGQAKRVGAPIAASVARDFIGAIATSGERRAFGLIVSTAGFTEPAARALEESQFHVLKWDMNDLLRHSRGIATRHIEVSFDVPDQTFWDEIVGPT